jgi:hypothetical protein
MAKVGEVGGTGVLSSKSPASYSARAAMQEAASGGPDPHPPAHVIRVRLGKLGFIMRPHTASSGVG